MQEARDCLTRQLLEALFGKMEAIMERDFARLEANQAVKSWNSQLYARR